MWLTLSCWGRTVRGRGYCFRPTLSTVTPDDFVQTPHLQTFALSGEEEQAVGHDHGENVAGVNYLLPSLQDLGAGLG
ncbi:two component transcriptional regulator [Anopheles sinensis]|uniref:Two component transcriptional regulator n=1 Tax=Anopheles sinensis TaxID=74873 RepID=A0A084W1H1_ANOSI|nr:two component transcriptional regulator [Anopheles sinensis]